MNKFGNPESKAEVLSAICTALQYTDNAGDPTTNPLKEIRYIPEGVHDTATLSRYVKGGTTLAEIARPIFENGSGENGYYDINITGGSGTALFANVVDQFVRKMW